MVPIFHHRGSVGSENGSLTGQGSREEGKVSDSSDEGGGGEVEYADNENDSL